MNGEGFPSPFLCIFVSYIVIFAKMKVKRLVVSVLLSLSCVAAVADEGMWMVNAISEAIARKMQDGGLQMKPGEIYNADEVSLKDAIVSLDFGCTGSMISSRGLLITNHHCAYSDVHKLSTAQHNYLEDGFFADVMSEEIPISGKRAWFLQKVLDVTDEVNALIEEEKAAGRPYGMRRIGSQIERRYSTASGYEASLSSMWAGSRYYLALYEVYSDVRLVAAPPVSIAAFGGDVDNWEWPQQKCDFAMYRIYASPDGKPAPYSETNVPMRPKRYLSISTEGLKPGDFTMILGYPGSTSRYSSSAKVNYLLSVSLPITNKVRADQMAIMKKWMDADPQVRLKYADRYFSLSNVQENNEGLEQCCRRFEVVKEKKALERGLDKQGKALSKELQKKYKAVSEAEKNRIWYRETMIRGTRLALIATRLKNKAGRDEAAEYATLDMRLEKELFRYCVQSYYENVSKRLWGPFQKEAFERFGKDWDALGEWLWTDSQMTVDDRIYKFFTDVNITDFNKDVETAEGGRSVNAVEREYTAALYRFREENGIAQYPDANSTMRLTYGKVRSFVRDGANLPWQTFSDEILAKENDSYDFHLLPEWRRMLRKAADSGDRLPVNFLTDNDITGGNSGSPVLNAKGELVGLAFDGNKESLAGDVSWTDGFNRCVNVDIRFVLWTLKNYAGAYNILREINQCDSCEMENPLLSKSPLPYGAPQFDKIKVEHYLPAFKEGITRAKAEIDEITGNPAEPDFANTVEALEFAGRTLTDVSAIFYNLLEADSNPRMQEIAEEISPMMTEYSMYVALNPALFSRIKAVWDKRESLGLEKDQYKLLEDTYKGFVRGGALLSDEDKKTYSSYEEQLSLLQLQFSKNLLAATNAFCLNLTDEADLAGLPQYVRDMGAATAAEKGQKGWTFDLSYPSYSPFMQYSSRSDLRKKLYMAYNSRAFGGEFDNSEICRQIANLRLKIANILGYKTYADLALEDKMAKNIDNVNSLLDALLTPSLPAAREEVAQVLAYARKNGYRERELKAWDFSYWSEKYKAAEYSISDEALKPYFRLENCIDAVFGLATRLYGLRFTERPDIPGYHKDVKVYEVSDSAGRHLALFYADFFPRASKRGGAWMTSFREQSIRDGREYRPFTSIVTNFSKPTSDSPSLLTHYELTTFLHEFGHALHGMLAEGRYPSLTGTSVARDFVELPSQIMENWGYEPEYLKPFAKDYRTGEEIPDELIEKLVASKNYLAAYLQVRQLQFGLLDMAWHNIAKPIGKSTIEVEKAALAPALTLPRVEGTCTSTSFSHIFSGGYSAGYYSYKWAEVLEADAYSLFEEKGIFSREAADAFRTNILSRGSSEDEAVLYRNFRGHDPQPEALLRKLGITKDEK